jgi:2-oxoacid:acceptor oxidoreductase gamma subunit (pyruvate/2-ketoisovalerate family)
MVRHIRIHGRGGEGVKLASRIVSRAAFLAGLVVQDSPLYGAERRGAPVVAFARFSDEPIRERGYIDCPDAVVLMDHSLLALPEAGVLDGLNANSLLLVNSAHGSEEIQAQQHIRGRVVTLDVSSIAIELLGRHLLSAPVAGFTVKAAALASWDVLAAAVRVELAEIGLTADLVERNLTATRRAFDATPAVGLATSRAPVGSGVGVPFIADAGPQRRTLNRCRGDLGVAQHGGLARVPAGHRPAPLYPLHPVFRPLSRGGDPSRCGELSQRGLPALQGLPGLRHRVPTAGDRPGA